MVRDMTFEVREWTAGGERFRVRDDFGKGDYWAARLELRHFEPFRVGLGIPGRVSHGGNYAEFVVEGFDIGGRLHRVLEGGCRVAIRFVPDEEVTFDAGPADVSPDTNPFRLSRSRGNLGNGVVALAGDPILTIRTVGGPGPGRRP